MMNLIIYLLVLSGSIKGFTTRPGQPSGFFLSNKSLSFYSLDSIQPKFDSFLIEVYRTENSLIKSNISLLERSSLQRSSMDVLYNKSTCLASGVYALAINNQILHLYEYICTDSYLLVSKVREYLSVIKSLIETQESHRNSKDFLKEITSPRCANHLHTELGRDLLIREFEILNALLRYLYRIKKTEITQITCEQNFYSNPNLFTILLTIF